MSSAMSSVLELKEALEKPNQNSVSLLEILERTSSITVTPQLLHQTSIGRVVAALKKSEHEAVSQKARDIVLRWKSLVLPASPSSSTPPMLSKQASTPTLNKQQSSTTLLKKQQSSTDLPALNKQPSSPLKKQQSSTNLPALSKQSSAPNLCKQPSSVPPTLNKQSSAVPSLKLQTSVPPLNKQQSVPPLSNQSSTPPLTKSSSVVKAPVPEWPSSQSEGVSSAADAVEVKRALSSASTPNDAKTPKRALSDISEASSESKSPEPSRSPSSVPDDTQNALKRSSSEIASTDGSPAPEPKRACSTNAPKLESQLSEFSVIFSTSTYTNVNPPSTFDSLVTDAAMAQEGNGIARGLSEALRDVAQSDNTDSVEELFRSNSEAGGYTMGLTGNKTRDRIQQAFYGVFSNAGEIVKVELAVRLEQALFVKYGNPGTEYRDHSRELLGNIRDPANPTLSAHLISGAMTTEEVVNKTVYELASDSVKKQRQEDAAWMDGWRRSDWAQANRSKEGGCDLFKCARCGARDTCWTQKQTRSADEPMTTFVLCNNCGKRWKMC